MSTAGQNDRLAPTHLNPVAVVTRLGKAGAALSIVDSSPHSRAVVQSRKLLAIPHSYLGLSGSLAEFLFPLSH